MGINKKQRLFIFLWVFSVIIGGICSLYYTNRQRNLSVLLITIDALRPDHLGCYGYKRNTSPNIDRLAKEGAIFTQAIAQSSHTPPSICSIATSTYPHTHLAIGWGYSINPQLPRLAEILKWQGYKTVFFSGGQPFSSALYGFTKGFDIFDDSYKDGASVTNKALEFITDHINKPFFMWIHYMDTHSPYNSKQYYTLYINDGLYDNQNKAIITDNLKDGYGYKGIPAWIAKEKAMVDNPDYYIAHYDGAIRNVDEELGRLLKKLRQLDLDNKMLVIITSDHGEMLGEHGYYFHHGSFLYDPLIRVPLIIKCDKIIPKSKIINSQVSAHLDIMPTILDVLKVDKPKLMEGISLFSTILGKNKYPLPYVFADNGIFVKCIRTEEWKLIYNIDKGLYRLYNLKNDPQELNNLVSVEKEQFIFLKQKLNNFAKQAKPEIEKSKIILHEETKEKLKSLGYVR